MVELRNVNGQLAAARGEVIALRAAAGSHGAQLAEARLESMGVAHAAIVEIEAAALRAAPTAAEVTAARAEEEARADEAHANDALLRAARERVAGEFLLCTVTFYANLAHSLTRSP